MHPMTSTLAALPQPSARQLLLRLLVAVEGGELDAAEAIRACALFDISTNNARVALNRLMSAGLIENTGRGAYRLGAAGRALRRDVGAWRDAEARVRPWDGGWVAVIAGGVKRSDRAAFRAQERAFAMVGLHQLDDGLFVRPDNFAGGVAFTRERLRTLGLDPATPVFAAREFDAARDARARGLWDGRALERNYARGCEMLEASLARCAGLSLDAAARESYLMGDQGIRQIVFDPMLPEPLVSVPVRQAFVDTVRRYDENGRRIWRDYLAGMSSSS